MTTFPTWLERTARTVWTHTSALVAVVLIVLALAIGYWIGRPAPFPDPAGGRGDGGAPAAAPPRVYTCSMHPSVRLPDPDAKCPICFMDLIPVTDEAGAGAENRLILSEAAAKRSAIETATVGRFFPSAEVRLYGKLTYDETSVARITAYFPGRLDRLFVNYVGVSVAEGDHLAEVYSPQLLATFAELRQARLAVDGSRTSSAIVRTSTVLTLDAARERLRLYGLTGDQITAAEAGEASSDRLTIYTPMAGIVTHLAAREGDYVDTGSPIATVADLARLWLDIEAYESQLPMLRWGQPVTFTVEAHPGRRFAGRIAFIEPIVDERTRTAAVRVAIDNGDGALKPGMFASVIVRPRVAAGGAVISDELAGRWVCPMHPTVVKDADAGCDICGMDLVTAESLGVVGDPAAISEPLVIPRTAALVTGTRAVVYVRVADAEKPTYEVREIVLGPRAGPYYIVQEGLAEGEDVVVNGAFRIDSAMQIAAKPSMMMPRAGADGSGGATNGAASTAADETGGGVPDRFRAGLEPIYIAYLAVQEALAADDLGAATRAAEVLETALDSVDAVGLVGEPLGAWRRAAADLRPGDASADIDVVRVRFEDMSRGVIELQRRFGHRDGETWHLAFCPMAFDFKGAEWMQRGAVISNPYFGAEMPRCGKIRGTFPPLGADGAGTAPEGHEGHADE